MQKHKALISVYDKKDILPLATCLIEKGYDLLATGGTLEHLKANDIQVADVSHYTQFPEMLDGRVKTLHPKLFGGILFKRGNPQHVDTINQFDIIDIDVVVVNLYPFIKKQQEPITHDELIEFIDIGGPSLLRAAAKNYSAVTVLTEIADYRHVIEEIQTQGQTTLATRKKLAAKVFNLTAAYDASVANFLNEENFPTYFNRTYQLKEILRYGENPHQQAAVYADLVHPNNVNKWLQLQGKELSYNNYNDIQTAIAVVYDFEMPVCCAVKHKTPCSVAIGIDSYEAYQKAYEADSVSIFGGIVSFNTIVTANTATLLNQTFLEVIIAPDFETEALDIFKEKKNCRILKITNTYVEEKQIQSIPGGLLVQTKDNHKIENYQVVSKAQPTKKQIKELLFAENIAKHCLSNAIVITCNGVTVGIGSGQTSRIKALEQAVLQAKEKKINFEECVLASDAFFPFSDIVNVCAQNKIKAIIQPGGSIRDNESIDACNKHQIAMIFTGIRHFKH